VGHQRVGAGRRLIGVVVLAVAASVLQLVPASAEPVPAPVTVPAPLARTAAAAGHHLVAQHDRVDQRRALDLPGDDDEAWLDVEPSCASGSSKAEVGASVYTSTKVTLDYVLTGTDLRRTGTVRTRADRPVSFSLPSLRAGSYRLTVALHGTTDPVGDASFQVLPCVTVKARCRAVTFTNPAGNPAAYGLYSGHKKSQDFELDLAPGESLTVRADYSKIDYDVSADDEASGLGRGTVKVKQSCSHAPAQPDSHAIQTSGYVGCASPASTAPVELRWSVQPSLKKLRYEVLDAQGRVVAKGTPKGGRSTGKTLAAGSYTYRSYANGLARPFEDVAFVVLACVELTPHCKAIELRNPNAVAVVVVLQPSDGSEDDEDYVDPVVVDAGTTVTVPWSSPGASAGAYLEDETSLSQSYFLSVASPQSSDEDSPEFDVPQNC
jgi:hypothetical protein